MRTATKVTPLRAAQPNVPAVKGLPKLRTEAKGFSHGVVTDAIFLVQAGKAKITVTSPYACLSARGINLENDFCDQLFNHCEKKLARVPLKLARFGTPIVISPASDSTAKEWASTTFAMLLGYGLFGGLKNELH